MKKANNERPEALNNTYSTFGFTRGSDGFDNPQSWLVKGFFPSSSFGVIFGKPASLKSFLAIDIAYHIAVGKKWQDRSVNKGTVIYVAAEGQLGVARRIKALEQVHGIDADDLLVLSRSVFFSEKESRREFIKSLKEIEQRDNTKIRLIIVDTLARCFQGDENSPSAMNAFVNGCDEVRNELDTCIMCIHHTGKDESKGSRGSSILIGACDYEFQLKRNGMTKLSSLINNKQKDADTVPDLVFEFQTIDLGIVCEDNEPLTSLALVAPAVFKNQRDGENSPLLKTLRESFGGQCTRSELRTKCFPPKEGVKANTINQKFKRAITELSDNGLISIKQVGDKAHNHDIITEIKLLERF